MIRRARPVDAGEISVMLRAMVAEMASMGGHGAALDEGVWAGLPQRIEECIREHRDYLYLVADGEGGSGIAGFSEANLFTLGGPLEPAQMLHIGAVYVRPPSRGAGVGERLVKEALSWGRGAGCKACELNVLAGNPARRLYETLGFAEFQSVMMLEF